MNTNTDNAVANGNSSVHKVPESILVGLDVGSTTVKAVVMDPDTDEILWKDYQRHNTKQPEMVNEFILKIREAFPLPQTRCAYSSRAAAAARSRTL